VEPKNPKTKNVSDELCDDDRGSIYIDSGFIYILFICLSHPDYFQMASTVGTDKKLSVEAMVCIETPRPLSNSPLFAYTLSPPPPSS